MLRFLGMGGDFDSDWNEDLSPTSNALEFFPKKPERFYRIEDLGLLPIELKEEKLSLWRSLLDDLDFSAGSKTPTVLSRRSFHFL